MGINHSTLHSMHVASAHRHVLMANPQYRYRYLLLSVEGVLWLENIEFWRGSEILRTKRAHAMIEKNSKISTHTHVRVPTFLLQNSESF